jgi:hypothetical protein
LNVKVLGSVVVVDSCTLTVPEAMASKAPGAL